MEPNQHKPDLKSQILSQIEKGAVSPHSKWIYSGREYSLWFFWLTTVVVGASAVAISLFVIANRQYAFYEATHDTFLSFTIELLPYLWILIFCLMVVLAVLNIHYTKRGYRYQLWKIVTSSIVLSILGGFCLHLAGIGFSLDHQIGVFTQMYQSQEKIEQKLWQQPKQGRLLGKIINSSEEIDSNFILVEDASGAVWITNISELDEEDIEILKGGEKVRILGQMLSEGVSEFHACTVLPWMFEKDHTMAEFIDVRDSIHERLIKRNKRNQKVPENIIASTSKIQIETCAQMPIMRRPEFAPI